MENVTKSEDEEYKIVVFPTEKRWFLFPKSRTRNSFIFHWLVALQFLQIAAVEVSISFFIMLFKNLVGFAAIAAASPISTGDYAKALETRGLSILLAFIIYGLLLTLVLRWSTHLRLGLY